MNILETVSLYRLSTSAWRWYRRFFSLDTVAVVILFGVFTLLPAWALFFTDGATARDSMLLNVVIYTLALAALRALVKSMTSIMALQLVYALISIYQEGLYARNVRYQS